MIKSKGFLTNCILVSSIFIFGACAAPKKTNRDFLYFQSGREDVLMVQDVMTIQPYSQLTIRILSRTMNQEQVAVFNGSTANPASEGYRVDNSGFIEMPVIGRMKVQGLTTDSLQLLLVQKLSEFVKSPAVFVRFQEFNVIVLGEVRSPGTQRFSGDRVTLMDAISAAGDLTDFGRREDIQIIREKSNRKFYYTVDLNSKDIFSSPVYMLQPFDIVYVRPTITKMKSLGTDPTEQRRTGLLITLASLLISITTLVVSVLK